MFDSETLTAHLERAAALFSARGPAVRDGIDPVARLDDGDAVTVLRSGRVVVVADGQIHTVDATLGSLDGRAAGAAVLAAARRTLRAAWRT